MKKLLFIIIILSHQLDYSGSLIEKIENFSSQNTGIIIPACIITAIALQAYPYRKMQIKDLLQQSTRLQDEKLALTEDKEAIEANRKTLDDQFESNLEPAEQLNLFVTFFNSSKIAIQNLLKDKLNGKKKKLRFFRYGTEKKSFKSFKPLFDHFETIETIEKSSKFQIDLYLTSSKEIFYEYFTKKPLEEWLNNSKLGDVGRNLEQVNNDLEYYQKKFSILSHYWNWMTYRNDEYDYSLPFRFVVLGLTPVILCYSLSQKIKRQK